MAATRPAARIESVLACCLLMLTVGAMYSFSAFSGRLGELMNFDATELNLIGTAYNVGTWFGVVGGMVCDRAGPRNTILYGAVICNVGTLGSALVTSSGPFPTAAPLCAILAFTFSQGAGWAYLSGMKQVLQAFHTEDHATLLGTLACFVALSAGFVSQLYKCLMVPLPLPVFFVVLGTLCASLQLGATKFFVRCRAVGDAPPGRLDTSEGRQLMTVTYVAGSLTLCLLVMSLVQEYTQLGSASLLLLWSVMMGHVLALPGLGLYWRGLVQVRPTADEEVADAEEEAANGGDGEHVGVVPANDDVLAEPPACRSEDGPSCSPLQRSPPQGVGPHPDVAADATRESLVSGHPIRSGMTPLINAAKTVNFWLLVASLTAALSFPVTCLNNLTPLVQSMRDRQEAGVEDEDKAIERFIGANVALFSVGNSVGRLLSGRLAHRFSRSLGHPRWMWFLMACVFQLVGNAALLIGWSMESLIVVMFCAGFGLGTTFTIAPITTADLFGEQHFATMWGALTISPCISTELLGTLLAGYVADTASESSSVVVHGHPYCSGLSCFQTTFVVTLALEVCSLVAAVALLRRQETSTTLQHVNRSDEQLRTLE